MRSISPYALWIGHVGDAANLTRLADLGIRAIVDLADSERPNLVFRELVYLRFPLSDGAGNPPWLLRLAVASVVRLLDAKIPTLVYCSAGLSRSPSVAAVAIAVHDNLSIRDALIRVQSAGAVDVCPAFWNEIEKAVLLLAPVP